MKNAPNDSKPILSCPHDLFRQILQERLFLKLNSALKKLKKVVKNVLDLKITIFLFLKIEKHMVDRY